MSYEIVTVAGVECLCKFGGNGECLSMDLQVATTKGLMGMDCLVPHGLSDMGWSDEIPQKHKDAALTTLNQWITTGLLKPTEWNPSKLYYSPTFRGYAQFWNIAETRAISSVNILDSHCESVSVSDILRGGKESWMTDAQHAAFMDRCNTWKKVNRDYIEQKAKDFATYWAGRIGTLGSSGDGLIDALMGMTKGNIQVVAQSDTEKFFVAAYQYAIAQFAQGWIPFLDTDYGPTYKMQQFLAENGLSHLARYLPIKTWMHINFDDLDRSALFNS